MSLKAKGFGITANGFRRPSLAEILEDTQEELDAGLGVVLRKDAGAVLGGQVAGVMAAARDEDWEQMEAVHNAFDPRVSTGAALDGVSALSGTYRKEARASTGDAVLAGDNGADVFAGDVITSQDDALRYTLAQDATLATATARATTTAVVLGDVRSNSGNIYVVIQAGTTDSGAGPSGTDPMPTTYTDGTVVWAYVGLGLAFAEVPIQSEVSGPIGGPAGSLTKIGTPRSGWNGVMNPEDVSVGADTELDEPLRVRRVAELHGPGKAAVNAIRAAMLKVSDVTACVVFENTSNITDADGLPPHSVEPVISGPTGATVDEAWAKALLGCVASGIKTHGTTTVVVADDYGKLHTMKFTRPAEVEVYAKITVVADAQLWPSDGADRVEAAVLAYGAALVHGLNVRHSRVGGAVFGAAIPGTLGVTVQLDTAPIVAQAPADVVISLREIGELDSARTDVVVTFEDP